MLDNEAGCQVPFEYQIVHSMAKLAGHKARAALRWAGGNEVFLERNARIATSRLCIQAHATVLTVKLCSDVTRGGALSIQTSLEVTTPEGSIAPAGPTAGPTGS